MKRAAVIGCGALGTILVTNFARAEGWTLTGVMARTKAHAEALAANAGCRAATTLEELLADKPDLVVEIAGIGAAKAYGEAVLEAGCDFVLVSAGALADADWKARMTETALRTGRRIHVASGAIGGFDVLRTAALMGVEEATFESTKSPKSLSARPASWALSSPPIARRSPSRAASRRPSGASRRTSTSRPHGFRRRRSECQGAPRRQTRPHRQHPSHRREGGRDALRALLPLRLRSEEPAL